MKLGIIDLGTNSLRLDIYRLAKSDVAPKLLHREKIMIRLDKSVFVHHRLSKQCIQTVLHALIKIKKTTAKYKTDEIVCYATSALREAKNTLPLLKKIKNLTGITVQIISGDHEASLTARGILKYHAGGSTLLIDIGGGSTEISVGKSEKIITSKSIKLGSMRLQNRFLKEQPPTELAIDKMRKHIQQKLQRNFESEKGKHYDHVIGSAGTIKALRKVSCPSKPDIHIKNLEKTYTRIRHEKLPKLKQLLKTEGQRGDIILAGTILLMECLKFFGVQKISVTKRGLRDGILLEQWTRIKKG